MGDITKYCDENQHHNDSSYKDSGQHHNSDMSHHVRAEHPAAIGHLVSVSEGHIPRSEDGQHYGTSFYAPGMDSGQRSSMSMAGRVGQQQGLVEADEVHACPLSSMTRTEDYAAGPIPGTVTGNMKGVG